MSQPKVTAICTFANAGRFFAEAVESVLAQDFGDFELLLANGGSSDGSAAVAAAYSMRCPGRITYLEQQGRGPSGMVAARNLGLAHARGEYVACIDGIDRWRPHKLGEQVAIMEAHREIGMVAGTINQWRSWAGGADVPVPTGHMVDAIAPAPEAVLTIQPIGRAAGPCLSDAMIRRTVLEQVGGFEPRFTGAFEAAACFGKLLLTAPVHLSGRIWIDRRQLEAGCPAAGSTAESSPAERAAAERAAFLRWYCAYLKTCDAPRRKAVLRAARRAQWADRLKPALWRDMLLRVAPAGRGAAPGVAVEPTRTAPR